jgi:hypothetical protein
LVDSGGSRAKDKKPLLPNWGEEARVKVPGLGLPGCFPTQGGEWEMPIKASELIRLIRSHKVHGSIVIIHTKITSFSAIVYVILHIGKQHKTNVID